MNKYEILIYTDVKYVSYSLISINDDKLKIIKEIDNDKYKENILKFYNSKYDALNNTLNVYLNGLLSNKNCITTSNIDDITKCLLLFLFSIYHNEFIKRVTYGQLKNTLNNLKELDEEIDNFEILNYNEIIKKHEKIEKLMDYDNISMITFTTGDYMNYTRNLIESIKNCELMKKLKIYCIDEKAFDFLKQYKNIRVIKSYDENIKPGIKEYLKEDWNITVINKIKCIYHELLISEYVLYIDGDIVINNCGIIDYLHSEINKENNDILFQQNIGDRLCSGCMYIRSNPKTRELFNYQKIDMNDFICDEDYVNKNKDKINYKCLRRNTFPIERYYRKYLDSIEPYIIHFNFETGFKKEKSIKELGYWYI
tara:strand:+ start:760 stop:1863 length:1104 start_codon:yes stop_codon:yes gene_type:complete